jgi:hypothetical protein
MISENCVSYLRERELFQQNETWLSKNRKVDGSILSLATTY